MAVPGPALTKSAQTPDENTVRCNNGNEPNLIISGCTALIQSGRAANLAIAFYNRGTAYGRKGDYDRAIQDFDQAIRLNPRLAGAFQSRGLAYWAKGDNDRAIQDYDQAIRLDPTFAAAFNNRCYARAIVGRLMEALTDCNESLRLRPGNVYTLDSLAFTYLRMQQWDRAIADHDAALKIDAKRAQSLYGRGIAKLRKGDTVDGETDIATATRLQPTIADEMGKLFEASPALSAPEPAVGRRQNVRAQPAVILRLVWMAVVLVLVVLIAACFLWTDWRTNRIARHYFNRRIPDSEETSLNAWMGLRSDQLETASDQLKRDPGTRLSQVLLAILHFALGKNGK